jgi:signal transduction histidine kinase
VLLRVEDNGIGMSKEALDKIFIPFYTTKDINEGTGLGLPVVHGIVTSHGGRIDVTSAPGVGTRFEIRLPAATRAPGEEHDTHGRHK